MYRVNRQEGLTLFELLIVIAIIGMLAALAIPNMQSFINNQRIKTTATEIVTLINSAKAEAVKYNTPVAITAATISKDGKLHGTAESWSKGNAAVAYRIQGRSIYGNIDYQAGQDTQIAQFKKNIKVEPKSRLDSLGENDFTDNTNLILIAYPNGSVKTASLATKTANTTITEGATVIFRACIDTKCKDDDNVKDVIVAGNGRAYLPKPKDPKYPAATGKKSGKPPTTP